MHPGHVLFSLLFLFLHVVELKMAYKVLTQFLPFIFTEVFSLGTYLSLFLADVFFCWVLIHFLIKNTLLILEVLTHWLVTHIFKHYVQSSNLQVTSILLINLSFVKRFCKHSWHSSCGPTQWFFPACSQLFPPALLACHPPDSFIQKLCDFIFCFPLSPLTIYLP